MNKQNEHLIHARTLRADILSSPDIWLPRRESLLEWLNLFVVRGEVPAYAPDETEADDLGALDQFLRKMKIPVAA